MLGQHAVAVVRVQPLFPGGEAVAQRFLAQAEQPRVAGRVEHPVALDIPFPEAVVQGVQGPLEAPFAALAGGEGAPHPPELPGQQQEQHAGADGKEKILFRHQPGQQVAIAHRQAQQLVAGQPPQAGEQQVQQADAEGTRAWIHYREGSELLAAQYSGWPLAPVHIKKTGWFSRRAW